MKQRLKNVFLRLADNRLKRAALRKYYDWFTPYKLGLSNKRCLPGYKWRGWKTYNERLLNGGILMKDKDQETSEGLNQIFEIINAKGDIGEINDILKNGSTEDETGNSAVDS